MPAAERLCLSRAERITDYYMRSKLSWVTFIPLALAACFFKIAKYILPPGAVFGLNELVLDYIYLGCVVLILIFSFLFCLLDKRIAKYYIPHRNILAGVLALASALIFAGEGANNIYRMITTGEIEALKLVDAILVLLAAVIFVVLGLSHTMRSSGGKKYVVFNIIPALFFAERMILTFVDFTTVSIKVADVPRLACYIFATLFFFNYAVVLSLVKTKSALKSCFIFGFPAIASMLIYGVSKLVFEPDTQMLVNNAEALEITLIGAYILAFIIELTIFVRDKDSVIIAEDEDYIVEEKVEDFVVKTERAEDDSDSADSYLANTDTSDYLYRVNNTENDNPESYAADDDGYLTSVQEESESDDRPADYVSKLDDIDKLILEITEQID